MASRGPSSVSTSSQGQPEGRLWGAGTGPPADCSSGSTESSLGVPTPKGHISEPLFLISGGKSCLGVKWAQEPVPQGSHHSLGSSP